MHLLAYSFNVLPDEMTAIELKIEILSPVIKSFLSSYGIFKARQGDIMFTDGYILLEGLSGVPTVSIPTQLLKVDLRFKSRYQQRRCVKAICHIFKELVEAYMISTKVGPLSTSVVFIDQKSQINTILNRAIVKVAL